MIEKLLTIKNLYFLENLKFNSKKIIDYLLAAMSQQVKAIEKRVWGTRGYDLGLIESG